MKKLLIVVISLSLILISGNCFAQDDYGKDADYWGCSCFYTGKCDESGSTKLAEDFEIRFTIHKDDKKTAIIKTPYEMTYDALVVPNFNGGFSILQCLDKGNFAVTTVDMLGTSAHSRNMIFKGVSISHQYYGNCVCTAFKDGKEVPLKDGKKYKF